ncbi:MAG: putative ABC transporter permease, partial [Oscillospiraceae bacterium]|nr:putative ABC transporter permease [Oscillospiraceae bacterium]
MSETFYNVIWLFFAYSFMGWLGETAYAAVREKRYVDRSLLFGPLCVVYGVSGTLITFALEDLVDNWFFLILFSAIYATVVEWITGHILARLTHTRWWDYTSLPWNLDGYVSLPTSLVWGALGAVAVRWIMPLVGSLGAWIPDLISHFLLWGLLGIFALDCFATALTLAGTVHYLPRVEELGNRLAAFSVRLGTWVLKRTEKRIQKAHPKADFQRKRAKSQVFAAGCGFHKLFWIFLIGAFLGDNVETLFCRATMGAWMSRSSVVWGDFSLVWGFALALASLLLYRYRDRSDAFLFMAGTLLGGAYEYFCSVFTELAFGVVFWDYSHLPFNLGGRVNLLYCFFWGIAAVIWIRVCYPKLSGLIEKMPPKLGKPLTWIMVVFMVCNVALSGLALARQQGRVQGVPPQNLVDEYMDERFGDERL